MPPEKFDETDRRAVLDAINSHLPTPLVRVGNRRKWFRDGQNRSYWILGGYGEWHGVPAEMMDAEAARPTGGFLVIVLRRRSTLTIFLGPLQPIIAEKDRLSRAKLTGDYQFTLKRRGRHLVIDTIPNAVLTELADFSFPNADKEALEKRREAERLLGSLSPDQRQELIKQLKSEA